MIHYSIRMKESRELATARASMAAAEADWASADGLGRLADGLERLARDVDLRRSLGDAARCDVLAHHTWHAHVGRTLEALNARVRTSAA